MTATTQCQAFAAIRQPTISPCLETHTLLACRMDALQECPAILARSCASPQTRSSLDTRGCRQGLCAGHHMPAWGYSPLKCRVGALGRQLLAQQLLLNN